MTDATQDAPRSPVDRFGIRRRDDGRVAAGVAGGIADRLGIDVVYVRSGFIVLGLVWGVGLLLYAGIWAATLDQEAGDVEPSEHASREQRIGMGAVFVGVLLLLRSIGLWTGDSVIWPSGAIVFGIAFLLDRQDIDGGSALRRLFDPRDRGGRSRTVIGVVLLLVGLSIFGSAAVPEIGTSLLAVLVTGIGLTFLFGPWVWRLAEDLGSERRERIRQEERAEMAAHLHDSVLQTLALIQRTDDPRRMVTLARAQERELRRWLYESAPSPGDDRLSTALQASVDRIEADFDKRVELVSVGDLPMDGRLRALVGAAGEAMTNAAKHAGIERISVYSEVSEDAIEVFVTDQGVGFDDDGVGDDRKGIAESILGRMSRHGGSATIMSENGEGTEVHLVMPREREQ
jgi:phage shock protein PspC (stress-responsive transcriptional regulator)